MTPSQPGTEPDAAVEQQARRMMDEALVEKVAGAVVNAMLGRSLMGVGAPKHIARAAITAMRSYMAENRATLQPAMQEVLDGVRVRRVELDAAREAGRREGLEQAAAEQDRLAAHFLLAVKDGDPFHQAEYLRLYYRYKGLGEDIRALASATPPGPAEGGTDG